MERKHEVEALQLLAAEGLPSGVSQALIRHGRKLHRLAEAECNGDYPADNGQRKVDTCPLCESAYAPESFTLRPIAELKEYLPARYTQALPASIGDEKRSKAHAVGKDYICPSCNAELTVLKMMAPYIPKGYGVIMGGDPRGAVLVVKVPSGKTNDWGRTGIVCG